jgi:hypothetical protein
LYAGVHDVCVQAVGASFGGSSLEGWGSFTYNVTGIDEDPIGPLTGCLELNAVRPRRRLLRPPVRGWRHPVAARDRGAMNTPVDDDDPRCAATCSAACPGAH